MRQLYKDTKQLYMHVVEGVRRKSGYTIPHFVGVPVFIVLLPVGLIRGAIIGAMIRFAFRKN